MTPATYDIDPDRLEEFVDGFYDFLEEKGVDRKDNTFIRDDRGDNIGPNRAKLRVGLSTQNGFEYTLSFQSVAVDPSDGLPQVVMDSQDVVDQRRRLQVEASAADVYAKARVATLHNGRLTVEDTSEVPFTRDDVIRYVEGFLGN